MINIGDLVRMSPNTRYEQSPVNPRNVYGVVVKISNPTNIWVCWLTSMKKIYGSYLENDLIKIPKKEKCLIVYNYNYKSYVIKSKYLLNNFVLSTGSFSFKIKPNDFKPDKQKRFFKEFIEKNRNRNRKIRYVNCHYKNDFSKDVLNDTIENCKSINEIQKYGILSGSALLDKIEIKL